jgi:uncharacterized membrane protein YagU involved in acid resistance
MMSSDTCVLEQTPLRVDGVLVAASGFLATVLMTTVMFSLPLLGAAQIDLPIWTVRIFTSDAVRVAGFGMLLHLFVGFAYAWVFAEYVEPRLTLTPLVAGLLFGVSLWLFAQAIAVPTLGAIAESAGRAVSPGWFSMHLGVSSALSSLLAHIVYGLALSLVYGHHAPDGGRTRCWTESCARY